MDGGTKEILIRDPRKTIFKISGATLVALLAIVTIVFEWGNALLDSEYMTDRAYAAEKEEMELAVKQHEARIETQVEKIADAQKQQKKVLDEFIVDFTAMRKSIALADAVDLYNDADEALYTHERYEASDGVTASSADRRHELERRKAAAKEYRDCVLEERPNCEALRPR